MFRQFSNRSQTSNPIRRSGTNFGGRKRQFRLETLESRQLFAGDFEIAGSAWQDLDANGVIDPGEPALSGATVFLDQNDNGQLDEQSTVEPDDYAADTIINSTTVTLTATGNRVSDTNVLARRLRFASTGSSAFAVSNRFGWNEGSAELRADFISPQSFVSIDFVSDDTSDYGRLEAYDLAGDLIGSFDTSRLQTGESETAMIQREQKDIATIVAYGIGRDVIILDRLVYGESEPSTITDSDGRYQFTDLPGDRYVVRSLPQNGWQESFPLAGHQTNAGRRDFSSLPDFLANSHEQITRHVPDHYLFIGGNNGTSINDGGRDMYDVGNRLRTDLDSFIPYSGGTVLPGDDSFGAGSRYFTVKQPGLFVLGADNISIDSFGIYGNNGADGAGQVDTTKFTINVSGRDFTAFVKRVYGAGDPSINHVILVPGNGDGIEQTFSPNTDSDLHTLSGLAEQSELYYLLVSTRNRRLDEQPIRDLASTFLEGVLRTTPFTFGHFPVPGNRITGTVWFDENGNGVRDTNELGVAGRRIMLDLDQDGQLSQPTTAEPDAFPPSTPLTNSFSNVTLSALGVDGANVTSSVIYNPSPDNQGFSTNRGLGWREESQELFAEFSDPVDFVQIDFISDDPSDVGFLEALDRHGNVVGHYTTDRLSAGEMETATIEREQSDIASIRAFGVASDVIFLDRLVFGSPEPAVVSDEHGNYSFDRLQDSSYVVRALATPNWEPTHPSADHHETEFRLPDLTGMVQHLERNHSAITNLIPHRFDFSEGQVGTSISDGGDDMYDGGNRLETNLGRPIPYSDMQIAAGDNYFGASSEYVTAKVPGLFVMAAHNAQVEEFRIVGNTGADGAGNVHRAQLQTYVNGRLYTLFTKRIYNANDPSINQLFLVPGDGSDQLQTVSQNSDDDFHQVSGLANINDFYYLLFASENGRYVDDATMIRIANQFLGFFESGQSVSGLDFGTRPTTGNSIQGVKWNDLNRNGVREENEPPLENVIIYVDLDEDGMFDQEQVIEPDDFAAQEPIDAAVPDVAISAVGPNVDQPVRVGILPVPGESLGFVYEQNTGWNEGTVEFRAEFSEPISRVQLSFVSDDSSDFGRLVAYDEADEIIGAATTQRLASGESEVLVIDHPHSVIASIRAFGVGGDIIFLDRLVYGVSEPHTTTNHAGEYRIEGLDPGTYRIAEVQPSGWGQSFPQQPLPHGLVGIDFDHSVEPASEFDFSIQPPIPPQCSNGPPLVPHGNVFERTVDVSHVSIADEATGTIDVVRAGDFNNGTNIADANGAPLEGITILGISQTIPGLVYPWVFWPGEPSHNICDDPNQRQRLTSAEFNQEEFLDTIDGDGIAHYRVVVGSGVDNVGFLDATFHLQVENARPAMENWSVYRGGGNPDVLENLIDESGTPTSIDLRIDSADNFLSGFETAFDSQSLPSHTQSLAGLNGYLLESDGDTRFEMQWQDLEPLRSYDIYVFSARARSATNVIEIVGESRIVFHQTTVAALLGINGEFSEPHRPLESYKKTMRANERGEIVIVARSTGQTTATALAGIAISPSLSSPFHEVTLDRASAITELDFGNYQYFDESIPTPENVRIERLPDASGARLRWDEVEGARNYEVFEFLDNPPRFEPDRFRKQTVWGTEFLDIAKEAAGQWFYAIRVWTQDEAGYWIHGPITDLVALELPDA